MTVYYSMQAALCFAVSHVLIRRGMATSNAITASLFSIAMSAITMWVLVWRTFVLTRQSFGWFVAAGVGHTTAMLSVFYALSFGKIVIVDPLINASPVLTLFLSTLFLKDLESITPRVVMGAICTVIGSILVVTV